MFGGGAPVEVEVKFDSYQGRYARERPFHPTQLSKPISEERLRVTFETTEAALEQMARWLMQYGEHARALRPAVLRKMMLKKLTATAALYCGYVETPDFHIKRNFDG